MTRVSKEKRVEFTIKAGSPEKLKNGCVVVGVYAGGDLTASARALDKAAEGAIAALLARGELDDKAGATLMLHARSLRVALPGQTGMSAFIAPIPPRFKKVLSTLRKTYERG